MLVSATEMLKKAKEGHYAAVPSLHAAYMFLTTIYAVMSRKRWYTV